MSDGPGQDGPGEGHRAGVVRGAGDPERSILHVDMDAFFASVEVLDHPELAGRPVIVGGSGARGVVASCTYEARAFGVRSAMPSVRARQLCPQAVFVDGTFARYAEVSAQLAEILFDVTPLVEPIGLDEAFLDVTGARRLLGSAPEIAHAVRRRVADELGLDCSVGVARSKFVAKLASKAAKPRARRGGPAPGAGVVVIAPDDELSFLHPMPVEALWGVGPATAQRLRALGLETVGDVAALPEEVLVRRLGSVHGRQLVELARAHDVRPVVPGRAAKSVGHEETFRYDVVDRAELHRHAARLADAVAMHLREAHLAGRTVSVKVRYGDFTTVTRSHTLAVALDDPDGLGAVAAALVEVADPRDGVRLLGVSVSGLQPTAVAVQLTLDLGRTPEAVGRPEVDSAVDAIRARFGRQAVGRASAVGADGVAVPAQRQNPWGPRHEPTR
ncbi:MAG TPA: DNA polymerase IV [Acidimicrobiales bacterium]|nr:DNA polymerase IV [Acidimicrobiales bacterium]